MVIRKEHAIALKQLLEAREQGQDFLWISADQEPVFTELEYAGLVRYLNPLQPALTYAGVALAQVLRDLYAQGPQAWSEREEEVTGDEVILEAHGLEPPEAWPEHWRWLGSEIIALLDAADRAGQVGPEAVETLMERGLAARVWNREQKRERIVLSDAGREVLEIYRNAEPALEISAELAEVIRKTPTGPAPARFLTTGTHEEHLLEAMRLVAYSVPRADVYAFTALGQAVKQTLALGGFGTGDVLTSDLLWVLADAADDRPITDAARATLQSLGYLDAEGNLTPAGEWALEVFRLWRDRPERDVWSFALEQEEVEVLKAIQALWDKAKSNPEEAPTFKNLRREMIDRKVKEYRELLKRYGRRLQEMPEKFRKIAERFAEARDLARWYDENFNLRQALHSLESFQLIESSYDDKGREVFRITDFGQLVWQDQMVQEREIPSTAVKAITMTRKTFSAPGLEWWQQARDAGLVGTAEPTASGYFYAWLAENIRRKPYLSRYEMEIFQKIPAQGITVQEVYDLFRGEIPELWIHWALEKLEARHLIEVLPDGNIVETEAGQKMDAALSGVPRGFGSPVNPLMYRVIRAIAEVGTLYVKERRIRILPRNLREALRRSGLSEEAFQDALKAARAAGFLGKNSVNERGLLLLEAVDLMNPRETLAGFTPIKVLKPGTEEPLT